MLLDRSPEQAVHKRSAGWYMSLAYSGFKNDAMERQMVNPIVMTKDKTTPMPAMSALGTIHSLGEHSSFELCYMRERITDYRARGASLDRDDCRSSWKSWVLIAVQRLPKCAAEDLAATFLGAVHATIASIQPSTTRNIRVKGPASLRPAQHIIRVTGKNWPRLQVRDSGRK